MNRLNRGVSTVLAFSLLAFQAILPWTAPNFLTQDGPSHLYNAHVIASILFHPASPYRSFYQLRHALSTNWATVVLFNLASLISLRRAEALVATFSVLLVFFCFAYLMRSVVPGAAYSPLLNFLSATWFLWAGFYNFYLGVGLFALAVGYFIRHADTMRLRQSVLLAVLLVVLFFTHVLPAALAILIIGIVAVFRPKLRWKMWVAALAPSILLVAAFLLGGQGPAPLHLQFFREWVTAPASVFGNWYGTTAVSRYLVPAVMWCLLAAMWVRPKGSQPIFRTPLQVSTVVCLVLYFFLPSKGFGGDEINLRLGWIVFVLAGAAAFPFLERYSAILGIYITAFLVPFLFNAMKLQIRNPSNAVAAYEELTREIPRGATLATIHYLPGYIDREYGYKGLSFEPLYHADSWLAVQKDLVVLSDYQALSKVFTLEPRPPVTDLQRGELWALEGASPDAARALWALLRNLPIAIDFVAVMGDTDLAPPGMELVAAARSRGFLRLYRRR